MNKHPYTKYNRRTDTYSVYAWIGNKRKVIARVKSEVDALNLMDLAKKGIINTTRYPNHQPSPVNNNPTHPPIIP